MWPWVISLQRFWPQKGSEGEGLTQAACLVHALVQPERGSSLSMALRQREPMKEIMYPIISSTAWGAIYRLLRLFLSFYYLI